MRKANSSIKSSDVGSLDHEHEKEKHEHHSPTDAHGRTKRSRLLQVPFTSTKAPPPPKASIDDALLIPEASANFLSLVTFGWVTPLLALGYARPLEASDLFKLQPHRGAAAIANKINASFDRRQLEAEEYNKLLANGEVRPGVWKLVKWTFGPGSRKEKETKWRLGGGRKHASLAWAMNDSVKWRFWSAGLLKVIGDTAQVTSPLLVKAIINFATASYTGHRLGTPVPSIGEGIGYALGLIALQVIASLCTNHFFYRAASTGVLLRGGLITAIYTRSLKLTSRARSTLTNGKLVNHMSTDVSRIDFCAGFFHMAWTAPIQMIICLILLILNLGPSAIAGFGFFILATPVQTIVMKQLFALRMKSMIWTDKRAKLLQELLGGMKVIKFFAWEVPFLARISDYRKREMGYIRSLLLMRAANNAVAMSLPVLASVIAFVTYTLTGHTLEPAVIFASLTLFNLLRLPLMLLPFSFSAIADAANATSRLYGVFEAELLTETLVQDDTLDVALEVKGASFTWDTPPPDTSSDATSKKRKSVHGIEAKLEAARKAKEVEDKAVEKAKSDEENVFRLRDVDMRVPRGQLVAIVGAVGSGKTSLLQGIIGEMRRTRGSVIFGGSVAYCPQSAWIQNATIRENICFGRPFEEEKYWRAVRDSCLEPDLDMLPNGDHTEVGEKGISLSGGQKQRVNICRAIYCDTDIQIFDDPLSALDAHVGKAVFQNVLQNAASGKTRILVTHALHFLPQVDYIYTIADGRIAERGTYTELMEGQGEFARFVTEFGSKEEEQEEKREEEAEAIEAVGNVRGDEDQTKKDEVRKKAKMGSALMQTEERNTGAIAWSVYKEYMSAGKGKVVLPMLLLSLVLIQGATVMASYWLVYWQEMKWPRSEAFYMSIYAFLGVFQAIAFFIMGSMFAILTYFASQSLHKSAIQRVMHAPMSFFETTATPQPLGRIMNRFSKDIDTIDNLIGDSLRMLAGTSSSIIGAIILISIFLPWFLIGVACIIVLYIYAAAFYRASARELKRLDAVLRSSLYSHFSESLSGLATIRAYGESERFRLDNEARVDVENRAYWLTVTNQRWLGLRVDCLGAVLTFIVAMLAVGTRFTISPAQTGLVLSYILSVQQAFGWLVLQSAEVENNMNSVERIVHYATAVEQEAPHDLPDSKPPAGWPAHGRVELKDVVLSYRPELPPVLKGISMTVSAGEKIGIVGRTGAGKSSIMTALYRLVELTHGSITIDGVDISKVGLTDLRSGLAIIPQDPLLFSGTFRSNLDPFGLHDDATLWDALKRAYLVDNTSKHNSLVIPDDDAIGSGAHTPMNQFTLDSTIEDEGGNLSIGQRSLVSLARALVKDSRVIILDEATASVDYETDRNIQDTIAYEFKDRTILCIAHRLRTIISYDRICVLDAGQIAEFDTPVQLYNITNGIFRGMCDRSSITLDDLKVAAK
ncbi:Oligomycin resistance ATP-dependent permease YOR1 [Hypsizygus marmoreus]|uniref:Oligomycin resistance ATP-dependent permease YOR1 n=1 Tax=Hypsizygus marmoreus TaxID=39966 RepID=A0A369K1X5_HYPMA|nr:Oligomycin resistance ATP-dependent permease YOR1 [Hypsizygus marmoreus]